MSFQGSLATYPLVDLLQWLEHHAASGRLVLERDGGRRVLDVQRGRIVFASSTLPQERLGTFLVERRRVPAPTLYDLLARHALGRESLTQLLVSTGALADPALRQALTELAEAIIFDSFGWTDGTFRFDPGATAPLQEGTLRIQLSLEAQILAFRGAKAVDDTSRSGGRPRVLPPPRGEEGGERGDDELFWAAIERAAPEEPSLFALDVRDRQVAFRAFFAKARERASAAPEVLPVFRETAAMLHPRLESGEATDDFVLQLAALDPFLSADLLLIANSLVVDRAFGLATPREGLEAIGAAAAGTLLSGLTAPEVPQRSSDEPFELLGWRASLARAVAASRLAPFFEIDREEAWSLGLLSDLAFGELAPLVLEVPMPSRPFRLATLEQAAPAAGRRLADRWALPPALSDVIASDGVVSAASPPHLRLVFLARELAPVGGWGLPWHGADLDAASLARELGVPGDEREILAADVARIFEFLDLPGVTPVASSAGER